MANHLVFSVLDLVGMRSGEPAGSAIARSVDLAQHVEQWGYERFWLAEHHSISGLACSATSVLIGHVAGATKTIRVGSGGVMLPNHAPLVVAEQFGTLEAMYPGRIDLGLGRAPGSDGHTMRALRRDLRQTGEDFPELLQELAHLSGAGEAGPNRKGDSRTRQQRAHHVARDRAASAPNWRPHWGCRSRLRPTLLRSIYMPRRDSIAQQFRPSDALKKPYLIVAVAVIAADTDAAARRLFTTPQQRFLRLIRNQPVELLPPVDSMEPLWSEMERAAVENRLGAAIVGSDATVKAGLERLVAETEADEVMVVTDTYEHADRLQSYERLAGVAKNVEVRSTVATQG